MKPERIAEIEQVLREAGVPQDVVTYAMKDGLQGWLHTAVSLLFLPLMLAGFAVGGFYLWPALEKITAQHARLHAETVGAVLYDYNFGFSLLLAMLAWIFAAGAIAGLVPALSSGVRKNTFVFSILDGRRSRIAEWGVRRMIEGLREVAEPERYVRQMVLGWVSIALIVAVALAAISTLAVARDVQTHSIFTSTAYIRSPFFPWTSTQPREWASAVSVETGCNHVERKGEISDSIIYQIKFADGASVRIGDAIPLGGSWLEGAEVIDRQLNASGVTFSAWDWLGRDPHHPLCIAALRSRFSDEEFGRVRRLLRLPQ